MHTRNFKTVAFTVLKLCYASKSVMNGRMDRQKEGRMDGRTNNPEAICPSNFFEVGGIKIHFKKFNVAMATKQKGIGHKTHELGRQSSNDHTCQIWFRSLHWLCRKCNLTIFPLYVYGSFLLPWQITIILAIFKGP